MYYFILNKPPGCLTAARDPEGRPTVYEHVPGFYPHLPHVGRLDFNSEGLLLFTNDGLLDRALREGGKEVGGHNTRPVPKRYHVKLRGVMEGDDPRLQELATPLDLEDGTCTEPAHVQYLETRTRATWVEIVITEGKNRQIRRLCERSNLQVVKLRRVAIGPLQLGELKLRWCRPLTGAEADSLYGWVLPGVQAPEVEEIADTFTE